jgi:hypothetical protein
LRSWVASSSSRSRPDERRELLGQVVRRGLERAQRRKVRAQAPDAAPDRRARRGQVLEPDAAEVAQRGGCGSRVPTFVDDRLRNEESGRRGQRS